MLLKELLWSPQGHGGHAGLSGHRSFPRPSRSAGRPTQPLRSGEQLPAAAQHSQDQEELAGPTLDSKHFCVRQVKFLYVTKSTSGSLSRIASRKIPSTWP